MFTKVLIANRGEIACRVIRTLKALNIKSVAVYSAADKLAQHVKQADEAYFIGDAPAKDSYLNIAKIIETAKQCGAQAIHPGYGFLSENAAFAEACQQAGIEFIGPPVQAIHDMGSKAAAKSLMAKHHVPILTGYHGEQQEAEFLLQEAKKIGFPVLIKASAGGGGRGMRVVHNENSFHEELLSAKREALASFANDHVIIEKFLEQPRHVEVQVFADKHQNYVYLFERDCSIQRRNQKVIEEAPAPNLSDAARKSLGEAAIKAAQAVNYVGAGTVEFLLDRNQNFYFMEMNTRLQVEHPVTEMITGEDLVLWQLLVASGEKLPKKQSELRIHGHAFEARLCAEDPQNNFLPATGKIRLFHYPPMNVRVDTGFVSDDEICMHYDSMLAKVICWGENREAARRNLAQALAHTVVYGVKTNLDLLLHITNHRDFAACEFATDFIAKHEQSLLKNINDLPDAALIACALMPLYHTIKRNDPWHNLKLWSNTNTLCLTQELHYQDQSFTVSIKPQYDNYHITIQSGDNIRQYDHCHYLSQNEFHIDLRYDHETQKLQLCHLANQFTVSIDAERYTLDLAARFGEADHDNNADSKLAAPMPGRIVSCLISEGDTVEEGQVLVIMEAMKMEHSIRAPYAGTVSALHCALGDVVSEGKQLVEVH